MNKKRFGQVFAIGFIAALSHPASGHEAAESEEHAIVLEIGPSVEHSFSDKETLGGGSFAIEFTPIEDVLAIEAGTTYLAGYGKKEMESELLFKKPFRLTHSVELSVGVGPTVSNRIVGDGGTDYGMAVSAEIMVWPTKHFGWFIGPEYGHGLGNTNSEQSIGGTAGILIGW